MNTRVTNRTLETLHEGDTDRLERRIERSDIRTFLTYAGDVTGHGVDREMAANPDFQAALAAGGTAVSLITTLLAARFPGQGTRLSGMSLEFSGSLKEGDHAVAEAEIVKVEPESDTITLNVRCRRRDEPPVAVGQITVRAPTAAVSRAFGRPVALEPESSPDRLDQIEQLGRQSGPIRMAVVNPVDAPSLGGAIDSAGAGLIEPVLIAPEGALREVAEAEGLDLSGIETVDAASAHAAAAKAAELAAEGRCEAIMKGKIHTDDLLRAILKQEGLRTARHLSHVFVEDLPGYPRLLFVADAAVNIAPDLATLRDIVQNAVDLARAVGVQRPRVAILSAVETVTEDIPSTIAAAAICKMADRGDITGCDVDGPLAMDNAVSEQAARIKGISSEVAGRADILIAPDLEAANILAKDLDYLAGAEAAGIALGARVPVALTSRADTARERRASAALAAIFVRTHPTARETTT